MANFTQKAIKESLLKLLNEKPLSKISVKDIVEDCGINRNSFYYHFQDIPALLEEMIIDETNKIIEEYPSVESLDKCIEVATSFALQNKTAALHIYNSVNRDALETYIMKTCRHSVEKYLDTVFGDVNVGAKDKELTVHLITCSFFGLVIDWMNSGMNPEKLSDVSRFCELAKGVPELIIKKVTE